MIFGNPRPLGRGGCQKTISILTGNNCQPQLIVPPYQRSYCWEAPQVLQLLNDLFDPATYQPLADRITENNRQQLGHLDWSSSTNTQLQADDTIPENPRLHYLGTIFSLPMPQEDVPTSVFLKYPKVALVDGQQRTTTLVLILLAALHLFRYPTSTKSKKLELPPVNLPVDKVLERLYSALFIYPENKVQPLNLPQILRVYPTSKDRPDWELIVHNALLGAPLPKSRLKQKNALIFAWATIVEFLKSQIETEKSTPLPQLQTFSNTYDISIRALPLHFANELLLKFQLVHVQGDKENPGAFIFGSMNSTGVALAPSDLIKNQIYSYAEKKAGYASLELDRLQANLPSESNLATFAWTLLHLATLPAALTPAKTLSARTLNHVERTLHQLLNQFPTPPSTEEPLQEKDPVIHQLRQLSKSFIEVATAAPTPAEAPLFNKLLQLTADLQAPAHALLQQLNVLRQIAQPLYSTTKPSAVFLLTAHLFYKLQHTTTAEFTTVFLSDMAVVVQMLNQSLLSPYTQYPLDDASCRNVPLLAYAIHQTLKGHSNSSETETSATTPTAQAHLGLLELAIQPWDATELLTQIQSLTATPSPTLPKTLTSATYSATTTHARACLLYAETQTAPQSVHFPKHPIPPATWSPTFQAFPICLLNAESDPAETWGSLGSTHPDYSNMLTLHYDIGNWTLLPAITKTKESDTLNRIATLTKDRSPFLSSFHFARSNQPWTPSRLIQRTTELTSK